MLEHFFLDTRQPMYVFETSWGNGPLQPIKTSNGGVLIPEW